VIRYKREMNKNLFMHKYNLCPGENIEYFLCSSPLQVLGDIEKYHPDYKTDK
jgi:hypothetical protein